MAAGIGTLGFGFAAGVLSILSPCVLPLVPLVLTGAASAHRWGMAALGAGLVLSFVAIGLFVATIGFSLGLTGDVFRMISAALLALLGLTLLSGALQARFAGAMAGVGNAGNALAGRLAISGLAGQFVVGLLLGAIWSPCVGPTLGAASVLAAQGKDLGGVALVMVAFAIGTALPLLAIGAVSRGTLRRWQGRMMGAGRTGKQVLGVAVLAVALLILTGADHQLEAMLVNASPDWLTDLTTRF
jgi:cytochrome c biogenesis protein CcdA